MGNLLINTCFILEEKGYKCWNFLSYHRYIYLEHILAYPNKFIKWRLISRNKNIPMDFILSNLNLEWDMNYISHNESLKIEHLIKHPELNWDWEFVSMNKGIKFKDIINNDFPWISTNVMMNNNITIQDIIDYPDYPWDWHILVKNKTITLQDILNFTNFLNKESKKDYNDLYCLEFKDYIMYNSISKKKNISVKEILKYPSLDLKYNPNVKFKHIIKYNKIEWCWFYLRKNKNLNLEQVFYILNNVCNKNHINNYESHGLESHPLMTLEFISSHPEIKWNVNFFMFNPNIMIKHVLEQPELFCQAFASNKSFKLDKKLLQLDCIKKWHSVNIIKRNYLRVFWDVSYVLGRKRLERSYTNENYSVW